MKPFDTDGLDLSVREAFETSDDVRSYLVVKFGGEYSEAVARATAGKITTILDDHPRRVRED